VLANDHDTQDADSLAASLVQRPAHGQVTLDADGSFTYTPADGFSGTDTFTYQADDGSDYSAPATVSVTVAAPPDGVQAVNGSAFGFETNVGLFGGAPTVKGGSGSTCGQPNQAACADGESPAVSLPPNGGNLSATDPDGNVGQYGPAYIFENHGPITVHAAGSTGPSGSVTASTEVDAIQDNDPFHAPSPDGMVSSTCSASLSGMSASAHVRNAYLVTSTDQQTGNPATVVNFPHDWDPTPNTTYNGTLNQVGDSWRIVFNEQVLSPDAITVNAVHLYLLGPTALGDMIIGQSQCGIVQAAPNSPPVATNDAYTATAGRALTIAAPGVLANDTDPEAQPLRASAVAPVPPPASGGGHWTFPSDPAHGSLTLNVDGSFTYTPARDFSGTDSFPYMVTDSRGKSSQGTVTLTVNPPPPGTGVVADFDGNGTTDASVFRPSTGVWYAQGSPPVGYGIAGDIAVPADYDGDGHPDVAVFRPSNGTWYIQLSGGGEQVVAWGVQGDVPVPADYDGAGRAEVAVFRPSNGTWYIHRPDGSSATVAYGTQGDVPVPADYDGDGRADIGVFRPSTGTWYLRETTAGEQVVAYGTQGDVPVPADYDGDGKADVAVFRPSNGTWYVGGSSATAFGTQGDVPVPGDYNGDGKADIAVFRPANGTWYFTGGAATGWGTSGDVPLPLPASIYGAMALG
jgi:VCBS repeat-containing protein